ncbi:hypothetical protein VPIG_00096 [Vibrio phage PWH3a-P1]|uniref:hypothetical protein n=1 Tax=Vibrio phage PWH3a-P1 TaxID=754058 RepID=UPI0002C11900|nr:hypothetical protein VPIG_00096 [Vibrio phage PWH3a-P1]AGH31954.1 hypothetical protein VPIG_00096 [Vibrio phage PWH3a-P1]
MKDFVFERQGDCSYAEFICPRYSWKWEKQGDVTVLTSKGKIPSMRQLKQLIKLLERV